MIDQFDQGIQFLNRFLNKRFPKINDTMKKNININPKNILVCMTKQTRIINMKNVKKGRGQQQEKSWKSKRKPLK